MASLGSDVNLFPLFLSFLLVNWRGCLGEVGGGRLYQWVEWERAHNKLRCFSVPASSFKAYKTKQDNNYLAGLSGKCGIRDAESRVRKNAELPSSLIHS